MVTKKYHANAYIMFFDSYTNVTFPWHSYGFIMSPSLYYQHESLPLCLFELLTFRAHVLFYRSSLATDLDKTSYGSFISISEENSVLSLRVLVCRFYNNDKVAISLILSYEHTHNQYALSERVIPDLFMWPLAYQIH